MARCGIPKYDKLPAQVDLYNVDALRYKLFRCNQATVLDRFVEWLWPGAKYRTEQVKEKVLVELDKAVDIHEWENAP